ACRTRSPPAHLRAGGDRVLHARQGRHVTLARSGDERSRPRLPADALGHPEPPQAAPLAHGRWLRRRSKWRERVRRQSPFLVGKVLDELRTVAIVLSDIVVVDGFFDE